MGKQEKWVGATVHHINMDSLLHWVMAQAPEALLPQNLDNFKFNMVHHALHAIADGNMDFNPLSAMAVLLVGRLVCHRLGHNPTAKELAEAMAAYTAACCAQAAEELGEAMVLGEFTVDNVTAMGKLPQVIPVELSVPGQGGSC